LFIQQVISKLFFGKDQEDKIQTNTHANAELHVSVAALKLAFIPHSAADKSQYYCYLQLLSP